MREQLINLSAELHSEHLLEENQRIYELLHVQINRASAVIEYPISLTGNALWQTDNQVQQKIAQRYLQQLQHHYQRKAQGGDKAAEQRRQAYQYHGLND